MKSGNKIRKCHFTGRRKKINLRTPTGSGKPEERKAREKEKETHSKILNFEL
jgi:hypothetical protein